MIKIAADDSEQAEETVGPINQKARRRQTESDKGQTVSIMPLSARRAASQHVKNSSVQSMENKLCVHKLGEQ